MEKRSVSKFRRFTITFISVVAILCLAVGVFCIIKNANNNTESLKSDIGALGSQIVGTTNSTGKNNSTSNPKKSQKDSVNSANNSLGLVKPETDSKTDKIESLNYVVSFDNETATLTYDLSKAQINNASLAIDSNFIFSELPEFKEGVLSVYPGYHGKAIKKIIFKSNYMQKDKNLVQIKSKITNFSMKFSSDWSEDIEIEFADFAFSAPNEKVALDLSEISSKNVTINAINNVEIRGGDAVKSGAGGCEAIVAACANLKITGDKLTVFGGNGRNTVETDSNGNGLSGGDGATAIVAKNVTVDMDTLTIFGGSGGNASNGNDGSDGDPSYNGHNDRNATGGGKNGGDGFDGCDGGDSGKGGHAYSLTSITINNGEVIATGGKSGLAGNGGSGGSGGRGQEAGGWGTTAGNGGSGGSGGSGGDTFIIPASNGKETIIINSGNLTLIDGESGFAGLGGVAGLGGAKGKHCDGDNCGQILTSGTDGKNGNDGTPGSPGNGLLQKTSYNGHVYELYAGNYTWEEAKAKATQLGGHLVTISNNNENTVVKNLYISTRLNGVWLGATNYKKNNWEWITGESFNYTDWGVGEPNNSSNNENVLGFYKSGNNQWNDFATNSSTVEGFIVEFE